MTYRRHQIAIDYINILMKYIIAYLTMTTALYLFDHSSPLYVLATLPAPLISYFIRRHSRHIWSFAILHLVLAALYLLTSDKVYYIVVFGIYLLLLTAISYYAKHKLQDRSNTSLFLLIYFVFIYTTCYWADLKELLPLCFLLAVIFTLLYILNMYLLNLDRFIHDHDHIANIPFRQIKNSNHILIAFLCCLSLLSMLIFSRISFDHAFAVLGMLMIQVLRFLFAWLSSRKPSEYEWTIERPSPLEPVVKESSRFMEILSFLFQWAMTITMIIGALVLILYTIYKIYQHFYRKGEEIVKDEVEFLSPFMKKERLKQKQFKLDLHFFGRSNNSAIRKYFAKAVAANTRPDQKIPKSMTPSQLSEVAILISEEKTLEEEEKRKLVTSYYEKARYSKEVCTKEEVQLVKKILKKQ